MEESAPAQDPSHINDMRQPSDFKGITFSKYKKTEVRNALIESILKNKIESACYWVAELVCAGHLTDIWESILYYLGKYIYLGNPKLPIYIESRYTIFRNIINGAIYINEMQLRNDTNIRRLFAEVICVLAQSPRKPCFEAIKINRLEEFDVATMSSKLRADDTTRMNDVFLPKDPKEFFIALNELAFQVTQGGTGMMMACYWIEWIIEFDLICRRRKEWCSCERRAVPVSAAYQMDIVWIVWDVLLDVCKRLGKNEFVLRSLKSLLSLFCIKYTTGTCKKRRYLLYYGVALLTETVATNVELIGDRAIIETVLSQINNVYSQVKKNEESPHTDYLFENMNGEEPNQQERTMRRLQAYMQMQVDHIA